MVSKAQKERARIFSQMHREKKMFILPNAWSAGSAYVFEKQGFAAVATTSAGVAYELGYPDGENIPFDRLCLIVEMISGRVNIPLSVDFERGYGATCEEVVSNAEKLIYAGAVGFNIEDGLSDGKLSPINTQVEKIKALSDLKRKLDIDFVINARTCAYWLDVAGKEGNLKIAVERGNAFAEAGADCVFIPGRVDENEVSELVKGINAPVNIILNGEFNDFEKLEKIGVRRLSAGSSPARYVFNKTINLADNLRKGIAAELLADSFSYGKANDYFKG